MTPEELRQRLKDSKERLFVLSLEADKERKLMKAFHFETGLPTEFLLSLSDDDLMEEWAKFVLIRLEEIK